VLLTEDSIYTEQDSKQSVQQPYIGVTFRLNDKSIMERVGESKNTIGSPEKSISLFKASEKDISRAQIGGTKI